MSLHYSFEKHTAQIYGDNSTKPLSNATKELQTSGIRDWRASIALLGRIIAAQEMSILLPNNCRIYFLLKLLELPPAMAIPGMVLKENLSHPLRTCTTVQLTSIGALGVRAVALLLSCVPGAERQDTVMRVGT